MLSTSCFHSSKSPSRWRFAASDMLPPAICWHSLTTKVAGTCVALGALDPRYVSITIWACPWTTARWRGPVRARISLRLSVYEVGEASSASPRRTFWGEAIAMSHSAIGAWQAGSKSRLFNPLCTFTALAVGLRQERSQHGLFPSWPDKSVPTI